MKAHSRLTPLSGAIRSWVNAHTQGINASPACGLRRVAGGHGMRRGLLRTTGLGVMLLGFGLLSGPAQQELSAAADGGDSGLIRNSPFLPPDWKKNTPAPATPEPPKPPQRDLTGELEFRGVFSMGGKTSFSVYDKSAQSSRWLQPGETTDKFTVARYNPELQTLHITVDGQIQELKLSSADDAPIPIAGIPSEASRIPPPPGQPPTSRPPMPPGSQDNARPTVPRRRIIRTGESRDATDNRAGSAQNQSASGGSSAARSRSRGQPPANGADNAEGSSPSSRNGGSAPGFVPPPPPNFVPPPPPI